MKENKTRLHNLWIDLLTCTIMVGMEGGLFGSLLEHEAWIAVGIVLAILCFLGIGGLEDIHRKAS